MEFLASFLSPPSSEEKCIYRVPVFSAEFCQALLEELEHFEQSDMPKGRPNTMNNHGVGEALPMNPGNEGGWCGRFILGTAGQLPAPTLNPKATMKANSFCSLRNLGQRLVGMQGSLQKSPC